MATTADIRNNAVILFKSKRMKVIEFQHVKPGKGGAFNQVELKSLTRGTKLNERFRSSENVQKAQLEERQFNFLYSDDNECFFMDPKTFEQISLKSEILGEKLKLLTENLEVTISFLEEKPLSIDLPNNIDCIVESTEGVVKGQTAASSYKPAKLKNGIDIMVPPFVEEGDKIILDTRSLEYVKKIN